jgi:hypothetical protein
MLKASEQVKLQWLRNAAIKDSQNNGIQSIAENLWAAALGRPMVYMNLVHALSKFGIHYQTDTERVGHEDIAGLTRPWENNTPMEAYERGLDDCDAKARFFVALALAKGLQADIMPWSRPGSDMLDHVYPAFRIGGKWLAGETTVARAVLGDAPENVPKEANGRWLRP